MRKFTAGILMLLLVISLSGSIEAKEVRSGLVYSNQGFGIELIDYVTEGDYSFHSNISFKPDNNDISMGIGSRYYFGGEKYNPFIKFGYTDYLRSSENKASYFNIGGGVQLTMTVNDSLLLEGGYKLTESKDNEYYFGITINHSWINYMDSEEVESFIERHPGIDEKAKKYLKENSVRENNKRFKYIEINPEMDPNIKSKIVRKKLTENMDQRTVEIMLGKPDKINRNIEDYDEKWVYGKFFNKKYLYFEDSQLKKWN